MWVQMGYLTVQMCGGTTLIKSHITPNGLYKGFYGKNGQASYFEHHGPSRKHRVHIESNFAWITLGGDRRELRGTRRTWLAEMERKIVEFGQMIQKETVRPGNWSLAITGPYSKNGQTCIDCRASQVRVEGLAKLGQLRVVALRALSCYSVLASTGKRASLNVKPHFLSCQECIISSIHPKRTGQRGTVAIQRKDPAKHILFKAAKQRHLHSKISDGSEINGLTLGGTACRTQWKLHVLFHKFIVDWRSTQVSLYRILSTSSKFPWKYSFWAAFQGKLPFRQGLFSIFHDTIRSNLIPFC